MTMMCGSVVEKLKVVEMPHLMCNHGLVNQADDIETRMQNRRQGTGVDNSSDFREKGLRLGKAW